MKPNELVETARAMMHPEKGLIAMDESNPTCNQRFAELGIPQTSEMRRAYRNLIVTTPDLANYVSGAILFDETIRQQTFAGAPFADALAKTGIIPGIKVDEGAKDLPSFPGEKITEGLDGLTERLKEYGEMGARFAKWRAVITIDEGIPTQACIQANAHALARYAAICQEAGIVPIVEPEVLMDGPHSLDRCFTVTEQVLNSVFSQLAAYRVLLEGMILKPNMVLPGNGWPKQGDTEQIADATIKCFRRTVPAAVLGIAFLSGGQEAKLASERLNQMHVKYGTKLPWQLTFSFSRAIQQPCLELWSGHEANVEIAQKALLHRAKCNSAARQGIYSPQMEN